MDRAAFLRSLDFLRPLPPGVWDSDGDDEEPYSGSTITPPTPSKNNAILLFEDSLFVVSIEPKTRSGSEDTINDIAENNDHEQIISNSSRKRGRGDDLPGSTIGPAFFQDVSSAIKKSAVSDGAAAVDANDHAGTATKEVEDAMDVENDSMQQDNEDVRDSDLKFQINSDPSLCTFEAAIMKKLPSISGDELERDNVLATPTGVRRAKSHGMDGLESNVLIFRFGHHFVFQVDGSAIVELRYVSGNDGDSNIEDGDETNSKQPGDASPPSKRQRNEGDSSSHADRASAKSKKLPPSLIIEFASCTFRVFSLEDKPDSNFGSNSAADTDTSRPSSRIWGTLAKSVESVKSRLMKAKLTLMQQFEIEIGGRTHCQLPSTWKMAPPGSGLAFHSWPESFESSSFHSNALKYKAANLEEDWSYCLGKIKTVECLSSTTSPQKSSSPSKTNSSSTHFEHGQEEQTPTKNDSSQSKSSQNGDAGQEDNVEKNDASNDPSELTHESEQKEEDGAKLKESQDSSLGEPGRNDKDLDAINDDHSMENGMENGMESSHTGKLEVEKGEGGNDTENENANSQSWKDSLCNKYHLFEKSAIYMEKAVVPTISSQQHQQNGTSMSHLTSCAESLSRSYLTTNDFLYTSQQCENDIQDTTSEMEVVLDNMFPARGRKASAVTSSQSEDNQRRIEELMILRKEAVAAKLALLLTPKR